MFLVSRSCFCRGFNINLHDIPIPNPTSPIPFALEKIPIVKWCQYLSLWYTEREQIHVTLSVGTWWSHPKIRSAWSFMASFDLIELFVVFETWSRAIQISKPVIHNNMPRKSPSLFSPSPSIPPSSSDAWRQMAEFKDERRFNRATDYERCASQI